MKKDRTFSIGAVEFKIAEIPAMAQWELSELIRESIGRPGVLNASVDTDEPLKAIATLFAAMRREDVKAIRDGLFEYVAFKTPEQLKHFQLAGLEDQAFCDIGFAAVYEVLGRAFFVNFTGSLTEMLGRFGINLKAMEKAETPSDSPQ